MIGQTISHYKVLAKLGSGGMGVVYKAEDTKLHRIVALKFLPPTFSDNEEAKKRFIHEAQAASSLQHNNICNIHDIQETDEGQLFIIMDCYEGESLKDKLARSPLKMQEAINITSQLANGLNIAHIKGIVHRDIKPANIFITNDGTVKILDFGLAKAKGQTQLTKMDSTLGTVDYMSPEQADGKVIDKRTDIWSIGVVLYEMLTGKRPFAAEYEQAVIYSILNKEPEVVPEIDGRLQHIIIKALAKSPDNRYQSAGEIVDELNKIKDNKSTMQIEKKSKPPWIITAAAAAIIIAVGIYLYVSSSNTVKETETIKTIAVLPFDDLSPKKDQGYFSDGLSQELINVLSRNPKLRVIAKTSSFSFKGTNTDIKTIAVKLNVKNILEGSVRKAGNNLRISADLVNVETEATLWSKTYDGTMNNIFALQDSISGNVAEALKASLLGKGEAKPEQKTNPEAYNAYLLGIHFYDLGGRENGEKAESYYEKALSIDSTYAPAWARLAALHASQALGNDKGYSKAHKEVEKALELNPNLADAYAIMGALKVAHDWDWAGADEALKKALELEPENPNVLNVAAALAFTLGKFNESIMLLHRAIEIDPAKAIFYSNLSSFTRYAKLYDESIAACRKCLELNPQLPGTHMTISLNYLEKGKPDSALIEIQKEKEPLWQTFGLAVVYYAMDRKKDADEKLSKYIKDYQNVSAYLIADIYAYRNEKDKAFEWLERAYRKKETSLFGIVGDPMLHNIVKDPRYAAFMKKMKLPIKG